MAVDDKREFNEDDLYDRFPSGARTGFGPEQGFNVFVRLNDPKLFKKSARENPVIKALLEAPFSIEYAQFKSSHRETEYFIHKPHRAMGGDVDGIKGIEEFPDQAEIVTVVLNHQRTLAKMVTRTLAVVDRDGKQVGQIVHKQEE